jgi:hypothetical protein
VFEAALSRIPQHKKNAAIKQGSNLETGALKAVDVFVRLLQMEFPEALEHSDIVRALLLQGDPDTMEIAYNWLQGIEVEVEDRKKLNLKSQPPKDHQLVRGISWLMSLGGPIMIALDQIDSIVAASNLLAEKHSDVDDETESTARGIIHLFGDGLMGLQSTTFRSMTVLACLGETWTVLREKVLKSVSDRFSSPIFLQPAASASGQITQLIAGRLAGAYQAHGFKPPYPTWPFSPKAIAKIGEALPHKVLMLCDNFKLKCLAQAGVVECLDLGGDAVEPQPKPNASIDGKFAELIQKADLTRIAPDTDDGQAYGELISTALRLYATEIHPPNNVDAVAGNYSDERRPALHARLTFTFHAEADLEKHYCFRVLPHANALSVQARLRAAMTASGIDKKLPFRHLFILRDAEFPSGKVTNELRARFLADGGRQIAVSEPDLRVFLALQAMHAEKIDGFDAWLQASKALSQTSFFQSVGLCPPPLTAAGTAAAKPSQTGAAPAPTAKPVAATPAETSPAKPFSKGDPSSDRGSKPDIKVGAIPLGHRVEGGARPAGGFVGGDVDPTHCHFRRVWLRQDRVVAPDGRGSCSVGYSCHCR